MEYLIDINNIDDNFLSTLKLHSPMPIQGGSYLAKLTMNDKPLLFQMPKCSTKKGIVSSGKRFYCDLLFKYDDSNVIDAIEMMENIIRDKVLEKSELWFQDPPTLEDIEYNWNESIKQTKQHFYLRTYIGTSKNIKSTISVYNSNQEQISMEDVTHSSNIITIIEVTGLKFSSSSFHINYCLRQVMVLEEAPIFNRCLINVSQSKRQSHAKIQDNKNDDDSNHTNNDSLEEICDPETTSNEIQYVNEIDTSEKEGFNTELNNEMGEKTHTPDDEDLEILNNHQSNLVDNDPYLKDSEENDDVTVEENQKDLEDTNADHPEEDIDNTDSMKCEGNTATMNNDTHSVKFNEDTDNCESEELDNLEIKEIDLEIPDEKDMVLLKKPDIVYLDIYNKALQKAKEARLKAIHAYLELKEIKNKYMIEEINDEERYFEKMEL
jgi:hypothetical protein